MQAGAQYRAMRQQEGKNATVFDGLKDILSIAGNYALNESPVVGTAIKDYKYAEKGRKGESFLGKTIEGAVVPGAVQDVAKYQDYDPSKDKNRNSSLGQFLDKWGGQFSAKTRHPKSIKEDIEMGVPGWRQNVR
jgi:hypothetical protein